MPSFLKTNSRQPRKYPDAELLDLKSLKFHLQVTVFLHPIKLCTWKRNLSPGRMCYVCGKGVEGKQCYYNLKTTKALKVFKRTLYRLLHYSEVSQLLTLIFNLQICIELITHLLTYLSITPADAVCLQSTRTKT